MESIIDVFGISQQAYYDKRNTTVKMNFIILKNDEPRNALTDFVTAICQDGNH